MPNSDEAERAIRELNQRVFSGRTTRVNEAQNFASTLALTSAGR